MLLETEEGRFLLQGDRKISKITSWSYVQENTEKLALYLGRLPSKELKVTLEFFFYL